MQTLSYNQFNEQHNQTNDAIPDKRARSKIKLETGEEECDFFKKKRGDYIHN